MAVFVRVVAYRAWRLEAATLRECGRWALVVGCKAHMLRPAEPEASDQSMTNWAGCGGPAGPRTTVTSSRMPEFLTKKSPRQLVRHTAAPPRSHRLGDMNLCRRPVKFRSPSVSSRGRIHVGNYRIKRIGSSPRPCFAAPAGHEHDLLVLQHFCASILGGASPATSRNAPFHEGHHPPGLLHPGSNLVTFVPFPTVPDLLRPKAAPKLGASGFSR